MISSRRLHPAALAAVAALVISVAACSSDDGTSPPEDRPVPPALRIVAGANVTDTIESRPLQALTVEVRDSTGSPLIGTVVRFEALVASSRPSIFVTPLTSPNYLLFVADSTDASGHAHVLVRFGTVAGPARVAIHVPALGLTDTARFTVTPGAATKVVLSTRDTALTVGKRFSPNASVADRFSNPRPGSITYRSLSTVCSVDTAGQITGLTVGRCAVEARTDAGADTARASVVPEGTIVAFWLTPSGGSVGTVSLDGSSLRTLTSNPLGFEVYPTSTRGGSSIVYRDGDRLMIYEPSGTRALLKSGAGPRWEGWARFSRDSAWVYFAGEEAIHRVRRDGTGYERITLPDGSGFQATTPDPSPDGTRVAYNADGFIRILALGGTTPAISAGGGTMPRWSPAGDRIAFLTGDRVNLMNADGSARQALSTQTGYGDNTGLDWSADGRWIVVRGGFMLELIDVATGEALPLPYARNAYQPAFLR